MYTPRYRPRRTLPLVGQALTTGRGGCFCFFAYLFVVWFLSWMHVFFFHFFLYFRRKCPPSPHVSGGSGPHSLIHITHTHRGAAQECILWFLCYTASYPAVSSFLVNYAGNGGFWFVLLSSTVSLWCVLKRRWIPKNNEMRLYVKTRKLRGKKGRGEKKSKANPKALKSKSQGAVCKPQQQPTEPTSETNI